MATFEVFVPPLDGYEDRQATFGIEPEELAMLGLSMIGQVPHKYVKTCGHVPDYGYVVPYQRGNRDFYLRGLYLHEAQIDVIGIPRRPEELGMHLQWHQEELARLQRHGLAFAEHLPVIVKDEDRWGECGYAIFTLAETIEGVTLEKSIKSHFPHGQRPAVTALGKLFAYYQDPARPEGVRPMRDISYMRQYIGQCLVDLDPLRHDAKFPEELAKLTSESERLRSKQGRALHHRIDTEWSRQLDIAIQAIGT